MPENCSLSEQFHIWRFILQIYRQHKGNHCSTVCVKLGTTSQGIKFIMAATTTRRPTQPCTLGLRGLSRSSLSSYWAFSILFPVQNQSGRLQPTLPHSALLLSHPWHWCVFGLRCFRLHLCFLPVSCVYSLARSYTSWNHVFSASAWKEDCLITFCVCLSSICLSLSLRVSLFFTSLGSSGPQTPDPLVSPHPRHSHEQQMSFTSGNYQWLLWWRKAGNAKRGVMAVKLLRNANKLCSQSLSPQSWVWVLPLLFLGCVTWGKYLTILNLTSLCEVQRYALMKDCLESRVSVVCELLSAPTCTAFLPPTLYFWL